MIPHILELKNFLSYGEPIQRIDFKDHTLICLSGKNGHGKTALLDALTWAVWGQARKASGTTRADEGLLRLGQTRMMVCLEFSCNGLRYRVRREFAKTYGKPYHALDFETLNQTTSAFMSLTEKTVRATQARIEHIIGLDYETFINSAFLRQGQANEFSKKSAKDRKQILATILGLTHYDDLAQQALEKIKILSEEKRTISALQEQYIKDLEREGECNEMYTKTKETITSLSCELENLFKCIQGSESSLVTCRNQKHALTQIQRDLEDKQRQYQETTALWLARVQKWRTIHAQSRNQQSIQHLQQELKLIKEHEKKLIDSQQSHFVVQEKLLHLKEQLQQHINHITSEHEKKRAALHLLAQQDDLTYQHHQTLIASKQQQILDLQQKIDALKRKQNDVQQSQELVKKQQDTLDTTQKQFEKRKAFYQTLIQRGNWVKNALEEITTKQKIINDTANPACPLCEQLLTNKRKLFLTHQILHNQTFLQHRLDRVGNLIKTLKNLLLEQHEILNNQQKQLAQLMQHSFQEQENSKAIQEFEINLEKDKVELEGLRKQSHDLQAIATQSQNNITQHEQEQAHTIAHNATAITLLETINDLERQKIAIAYDPTAYAQIQEQRTTLEGTIHQLETFNQSQILQSEQAKSIHLQYQELKRFKQILIEMRNQCASMPTLEQEEQNLVSIIEQQTKQRQQLATAKELHLQQIGSIENDLIRLKKIKELQEQHKSHLVTLQTEIDDYQTIAAALSKNGIQALLIEDVIPEIEQEANTLLSKLSDNQAQIFIESLKDLKSGGVKETLDIHIADAAGMRPYEMYSGGEAFRIDFALRIAIAKLLARRAGTALQTLVIDEGFGSQDEEGLAHIMDSIYAIQSEFSKIIIVSHLPEFKHNFPVHFIVEKGATGSIVTIEERG